MKEFVVTEDTTLKVFTDNVCAQASFCFRTLLKEREIRVNGVRTGADMPLHAGDVVRYYMTPAQQSRAAFSVLYEDDRVIVIDKESGVNSEAVLSALGPCFAVHRLDRNTAGVMIFAKERAAETELLACFRERRVVKNYLAVVKGRMPHSHAVEEAYLVKGDAFVTVSHAPVGDKIVTEYSVLDCDAVCSLLKVTLHTGKTHQIRAHLAFLGHPVLGDEKYGDTDFNRRFHAARQRLLAKELSLQCEGELAYLKGRVFCSSRELSLEK